MKSAKQKKKVYENTEALPGSEEEEEADLPQGFLTRLRLHMSGRQRPLVDRRRAALTPVCKKLSKTFPLGGKNKPIVFVPAEQSRLMETGQSGCLSLTYKTGNKRCLPLLQGGARRAHNMNANGCGPPVSLLLWVALALRRVTCWPVGTAA